MSPRPGNRQTASISLAHRLGNALIAPYRALLAADGRLDASAAGRAGSDASLLIALSFAVAETQEIFTAIWLGIHESLLSGLSLLVHRLSDAVFADLAYLLTAGLVLTLLAGRRDIGRDLDLACVAYVPVVTVRWTSELFFRALSWLPSTELSSGLLFLGYGWGAAILVLAWHVAQSRPLPAKDAPNTIDTTGAIDGADDIGADNIGAESAHRIAATAATRGWYLRWTGISPLIVAAALILANGIYTGRNFAALKPVTTGDMAPALSLPRIHTATAPAATTPTKRGAKQSAKQGTKQDDRHRAPSPAVADERIKLIELRGRVVVIDFWASWCQPCLASMPALESLHRQYSRRGLTLISVNLDSAENAQRIFAEAGYTMPLVADDGTTSNAYKVSTIPHVVVVDGHGRIRHVHRGAISHDELVENITPLLPRGPRSIARE